MIDAINPCDGIAQAAMDKAYDSNAIRAKLAAKGIEPVIPPTANRLDIIVYDKEQYKQRNKVERLFNKLKQFRRVATRYEKLTATFFGFVILALIVIMLRYRILCEHGLNLITAAWRWTAPPDLSTPLGRNSACQHSVLLNT